jgi:hypothetical protein
MNDDNKITPITFIGGDIVADIELNSINIFKIDLHNCEVFETVIKNFIYSNLYDFYNIFTLKIITNTFQYMGETLLEGLNIFNGSQNARKYLESKLVFDDLMLYNFFDQLEYINEIDCINLYRESITSILYSALITTIDYAGQFIINNCIIVDEHDYLYKECLDLYGLSYNKDKSLPDKYIVCLSTMRQGINNSSQYIKSCCYYLIDAIFNTRNNLCKDIIKSKKENK